MITVPDTNPYFLISPRIQDATLTIDLNGRFWKWCSTCNSILNFLSGAVSSLIYHLQVLQPVTLSN